MPLDAVLALFTGCRLEELAQLHLKDIHEVKTACGSSISTMKGRKRLKTKAAIRLVPIHPFILNDLKFLDYVRKLEKEEHR